MAEAQHSPHVSYTYGHYVLWPEHERWQIIDGVPYDMTPAPLRRHQDISRELAGQLYLFLRDRPCRVYAAPFDVRLPDGDEPDRDVRTIVQPDISVICDKKKLDDAGCRGAPDFLIEILSPSTAHLDRTLKTALYERHGVREFWIIDPIAETVKIHRLDADGKFGDTVTVPAKGELTVTVLSGFAFDMNRVMGAD